MAYGLLGRGSARSLGLAFLALMAGAGLLFSPHWLIWAVFVWAIADPVLVDCPPLAGLRRAVVSGDRFFISISEQLHWARI